MNGPADLFLAKTDNLAHMYSIHGRRCYLAGLQNGLFPDYGYHIVGEMGGIWAHPIKIADGLWLSVDTEEEAGKPYQPNMRKWLETCDEFVLGDGGAWAEHRYDLAAFRIVRRCYVPQEDPAVCIDVQVESKNAGITRVYLNVLIRFDIIPVWFSGWPNPVRLEPEVKVGRVLMHSVSNNLVPGDYGRWTAALGWDTEPDGISFGENLWGPEKTAGCGMSCLLKFPMRLDSGPGVRLVLAGDHEGEAGAVETVRRVLDGYGDGLKKKVAFYHHIAENLTVVETPEKLLNEAFLWSKLNLEWMTQTSPIVGTSVVAGYQDFPWYFGGDADVSIGGILAAGLHETAKQSLRFYLPFAERNNGRVPHEVVTNGEVYSLGHVMETTLFVKAVWDTYRWTGDQGFLSEMYPVCRTGIIDYTLSQPREDGIILMEFEDKPDSKRDKLCPSFVICGLDALASMADQIRDVDTAEQCKKERAELKRQMEEIFWDEDSGLYASVVDENNKPVIESDQGWPAGTFSEPLSAAYSGAADRARIARALSVVEGPSYTGDFGLYLRPDRDVTMPIGTGMAAVGEFNYDRLEQGMRFIRMIAMTVGHVMPGAAPEYVHPSGDLSKFLMDDSCYLQLWSAAMLTEGLLWGLLHIEPNAANGKVAISPRLPAGWTGYEIKNITVGSSRFSVMVSAGDGRGEVCADVTHVDGPKLDISIGDDER